MEHTQETVMRSEIERETGVLRDDCALLYHRDVRKEIKKLRQATDEQLGTYDDASTHRRIAWFQSEVSLPDLSVGDPKELGYRVLLKRFGITENQAPIVHRDATTLVFHSKYFCPTLEACLILGLDTRTVCKVYNEHATDILVKQIDPGLRFTRNYAKLRPYTPYCEEMISIEA